MVLSFEIVNLTGEPVPDLAFTDDLDAALARLVANGLPANVCGSTATGTGTIAFTGDSLEALGSCTFDVTLSVPADPGPTPLEATNTTSGLTGTIGGETATGAAATDVLQVGASLEFTKSFDGGAVAGGTVGLSFSITNNSSVATDRLGFSDDLDATLPGLESISPSLADACGAGSEFFFDTSRGNATLNLIGGLLSPGENCAFGVDLLVPEGASAGTYLNETSDLEQEGVVVVGKAYPGALTVLSNGDLSAGDAIIKSGSSVDAGSVRVEAIKGAHTGQNTNVTVVDSVNILSTGDFGASDVGIRSGASVTADSISVSAPRTAKIGQDTTIVTNGDLLLESTGNAGGSEANVNAGANANVGCDMRLVSGNKAKLGNSTTTTVGSNLHMNTATSGKCTVSSSAVITVKDTLRGRHRNP